MKKLLILICVLFVSLNLCAEQNGTHAKMDMMKKSLTKENYPIKAHHEKLSFECAICHGEGKKEDYKAVGSKECLQCHGDYQKLANRSSFLGYDDNIHASPHYPNMECNLCHGSHKKSFNYCAMCHSQPSMQNMLVP